MSLRKLILMLHLWAGAIAALFLIILGATGSLMVFEEEIDRALNPKLTWVRPGTRMMLSAMKAAIEKAYPGYVVFGFSIPSREDVAWGASLNPKTRGRRGIGIAFDPYTGDILGTEAERNNFAGKLHQFHLRLLLDKLGQNIVGWAGPFLLLLSISGLVLWWPRKIVSVNWKSSGRKINFDLHHAAGIWCSVFLMLFAITAIVIRWEEKASLVVNALTNSPETPPFPA